MIVAAVTYVAFERMVSPSDYSEKIDQITSSGQSYDKEHVDRLAALGARAVPAISDALLNPGEQFPAVYILALGRIGDPAATEPLLKFLELQNPEISSERTVEIVTVIDTLSKLGQPQAAEPLRQIAHAELAHPRVRLSAAAALVRIAEPTTSNEAREFIFAIYENRNSFLFQHGGREINGAELYSAVAAADTDRSVRILLEVLLGAPEPYVAMPVISYFSTKKMPEATQILDSVSKRNEDYPLYVRVAALEGLLGRNSGIGNKVLTDRVSAMMAEARAHGSPQEVIASIDSLRQRLQTLCK